jgi:excisionase family DNA binding protein
MQTQPEVHTIKEFCSLARISRTTFWKDTKAGKIEVVTIGTRGRRVTKKALLKYLGLDPEPTENS